jgi:peptide/nickel transport system substrate-binding protein
MRFRRFILFVFIVIFVATSFAACMRGGGGDDMFVIALEARPSTLDPIRGTEAADYRFQQLMFNTLVKKNERLDYVGELASNIERAPDGLSYTFTLHPNVRFHDGRQLTSADVKYTLETLLASDSQKANSFRTGTGAAAQPFIAGVDAPNPQTVVIRLTRPWTELLVNLIAVPIIPQDSAATQAANPVGSGPFRFVRFDEPQLYVDMQANENYWEGAPAIKNLRVRTILESNALQAELQSGRIDLAPALSNLSPDAYEALGRDPGLRVEKFPGVNTVYLAFNVTADPLRNPSVRQAIAHAINRQEIVQRLLSGQARVANSILPESSWAFAPGTIYNYDPARASQLLDEAGFRDPDGSGPRMRFAQPIVFKILGSAAVSQYAQVIQNSLNQIGIPVQIETMELGSLITAQRQRQYQMTANRWVGGNQDPIFLRDVFTTTGTFNRTGFSNPDVDRILQEATTTLDRERARALYTEAQTIISREMAMLPLWYPDNMVIARRRVGNIRLDPSGDWRFVRHLTIEGN